MTDGSGRNAGHGQGRAYSGGTRSAPTAEEVEGSRVPKGNRVECTQHRTQSRARLACALARIRAAAKRDQRRQFTTLLHHVWGYDSSAFTRTVDTHMARLRQKIETVPAEPRHLLTVHRVGYRFVP